MTQPETFAVDYGNVHIVVHAFGQGPRIITYPSLGRPGSDFHDIARQIAAAGFRVLCPEPRGLGGSKAPLKNITLHDYARDVAAIASRDGAERFVVAGHAFGNFVARTTGADYPARVRAVILLAATHTWPLAQALRDSINKCHMMHLPEAERLKHLQHVFFAPGNDASIWLEGWDEEVMHAERAATEATPKEEWWTAGTGPVLDVLSLKDPLSPPDSITRYRDEWGADRVTLAHIDNAAHALLPEQPTAVAEAIVRYMKQLP